LRGGSLPKGGRKKKTLPKKRAFPRAKKKTSFMGGKRRRFLSPAWKKKERCHQDAFVREGKILVFLLERGGKKKRKRHA